MNITTNHPDLQLSDLTKRDAIEIQVNTNGYVYDKGQIPDDWKYHGWAVANLREANEKIVPIINESIRIAGWISKMMSPTNFYSIKG